MSSDEFSILVCSGIVVLISLSLWTISILKRHLPIRTPIQIQESINNIKDEVKGIRNHIVEILRADENDHQNMAVQLSLANRRIQFLMAKEIAEELALERAIDRTKKEGKEG